MQDYRKLDVWAKAHDLVLHVYTLTGTFPSAERFGLTSQLQRSAVSVPSNIAEGTGRGSRADFARFLTLASDSAAELDYQLLLARDLGYLDAAAYTDTQRQLTLVRRMLTRLLQRVSTASNQ